MATLADESAYSDDQARRAVVALSEVLHKRPYGLARPIAFGIQTFDVDPLYYAGTDTDLDGNVSLGFNVSFQPSSMPGEQPFTLVHEGVHVNQVGNFQALNAKGALRGSEQYISSFTSALVGMETAADAAMRFLPGVANLDILSSSLVRWRMFTGHAYWLALGNVFTEMDDPRYTTEHAIKYLDRWAPDASEVTVDRVNIEGGSSRRFTTACAQLLRPRRSVHRPSASTRRLCRREDGLGSNPQAGICPRTSEPG